MLVLSGLNRDLDCHWPGDKAALDNVGGRGNCTGLNEIGINLGNGGGTLNEGKNGRGALFEGVNEPDWGGIIEMYLRRSSITEGLIEDEAKDGGENDGWSNDDWGIDGRGIDGRVIDGWRIDGWGIDGGGIDSGDIDGWSNDGDRQEGSREEIGAGQGDGDWASATE